MRSPEPSLLTEAAPELAAKDLKSVADSIRGAHSRSTLVGYQRLWRQFEAFVLDTIDDGAAFWKRGVLEPTKETPNLIVLWILNSCDFVASEGTKVRTDNRRRKRKVAGFVENDEEGGRPEDGLGGDEEDVQKGNSYTHACKMRAAASYYYAYEPMRGTGMFQESSGGNWIGNPSLSTFVQLYMKSLNRRKVQAGYIAYGVRSVTASQTQRIYVRNETFASMHKLRRLGNDENGQRLWAGREERVAMQAAYAIAFLCLLRHSEVLQIEWDHVVAEPNEGRVTITLPFRKTHQEGKIKPFYDRPVAMTSSRFLENFRNNLLDINEDPTAFGMHSFRRGGVQYLCSEKRWDIRKLCDWGGRSRDFDNLTIVRYLLGVNDNPVRQREDFLNPFVEGGELCHRCGHGVIKGGDDMPKDEGMPVEWALEAQHVLVAL
ncbi:hypothetical protein B0A48_18455 [Cryoendolithus antarcticus]|uniref:Tyr recombinase domain-containing protein n=1 Tax=Cryoendolithus antarcticus TaxID=1507870 RepID=A0A1V8S9N1_9PEZI|nr:hypothetical protein B0A48_18455 [Cryoendolithus antarcticus]